MPEGHFNTKQVIVIRKDLKMRRGKEIAQGAHASLAWLSNRVRELSNRMREQFECPPREPKFQKVRLLDFLHLTQEEIDWLEGSFAKVCVRVNSEEELMQIKDKAEDAGLHVELIIDSGKTEFGGEPTPTCLAIGPHVAEKIDPITGDLELY
jgi:PTH2 family peptidyl-tRNA hydrolase